MHLEVLVEDQSGKIALESFLPSVLGKDSTHTFQIKSYKGIGRIPKNLKNKSDPRSRILLDQLPRILKGYGKSLPKEGEAKAAVIVVIDLDKKDCISFKSKLNSVLSTCHPAPITLFRIAIEEGEAWLLGDLKAVCEAFPKAKKAVLNRYVQDSICDTWEMLADAVFPGGSTRLKKLGWPHPGIAKCNWATRIAPLVDVEHNHSKSFQVFRDGVRNLVQPNP